MGKLSRTNAITVFAAGAGMVAALAFAVANTILAGVALSAALVLVAALVRSASRDQELRHRALMSVVAAGNARIERLEAGATDLGARADLILKAHRRTVRVIMAQGDRVELSTEAMSRRILSDLNAARLEANDRHSPL